MAFIKQGEAAQILQGRQYPVAAHLHNPLAERVLSDPSVIARFEKVAADLKAVAPKAKDFLYFSAVMMHAAEAAIVNSDGSLKKDASGNDVTASWDKSDGTWKWQCSDSNIMPYKNANNDIFPEEELLKAHKQWIGRPLCLDHKSSSVDFIRGVVVDTYYDNTLKRVIALCALDKLNYPDLARKVQTRVSHCVSMGTAVGRAICTEPGCHRVAQIESDFCEHMRNKSCYGEINIDLKPIELSIVVNGADPKAKIKHIIAAANSLAQYTALKEKQFSKISGHEMVDPQAISTIKTDLEGIINKLQDLEDSAERVEEIEESEEEGSHPQENEMEVDASLEDLTIKLAGVFSGLHKKLDNIQDNMKNLQGKGEGTMTNNQAALETKAYFQGGGGPNEPTPGKPKYEKEEAESIRNKDDKHMQGAPPFPGVGSVDGLYGDDLKKKEMLLRAEKKERAMRRQAAVERAKKALETKAYFQGGGGVNEPTPGKPKYEKEEAESIRNKDDKHMQGAPPFPGVGSVDGLYGDDLKKKEMLLRASLKGRFVKAANEDGTENKGESRWHVYADKKIVLTATVNELTNGKTDTLYDSVASRDFGKKILNIVRANGAKKANEILKGAQVAPMPEAPPAPAAEPMPAELPGADEEPRDAGGTGDPKEELPELLTQAENTVADIRAAVEALLEEGQAGLESFDELSEGMGAEAQTIVGLNKLGKKVGKAVLVGMKSAEHELTEHIKELKMAAEILDGIHKVPADKKASVNGIITDAIEDGKKIVASAHGLMSTFVKYAGGLEAVEKRASLLKSAQTARAPMKARVPGEPAPAFDPASVKGGPSASAPADESELPANFKWYPKPDDLGPNAVDKALQWEPGQSTDFLGDKYDGSGSAYKQKGESQERDIDSVNPFSLPYAVPTAGKTQRAITEDEHSQKGGGELAYSDDGEGDDMTGDKQDLDVNLPGGIELKNVASKEQRALAREKLAAAAMKFHPLLQEAHPSGGETTQLDIKPTGDLAKVERIDETHAKMLELAKAPPRVRQAAEEINRLVVKGQINPETDFPGLISEGLDKDAVAYWKAYWGQASEGSQFAAELVKEHAAKKKASENEAYKVKVSRAYDLAHDMVRRGMLAENRDIINSQVNELLAMSDKSFDSIKRFTEKQTMQKQASIPQVGMLSGEPTSVLVAGPPAAPTDLSAELSAAFSDFPLKGRLF